VKKLLDEPAGNEVDATNRESSRSLMKFRRPADAFFRAHVSGIAVYRH
jgi:hypothetical protein